MTVRKFKVGDRVERYDGRKWIPATVVLDAGTTDGWHQPQYHVIDDGYGDTLLEVQANLRPLKMKTVSPEEYKVKDSGTREQFATGARRDQRAGKGRYDLIPPESEAARAKILEAGARKYGDRNWEIGMPFSRVFDSLRRHLNQWAAGQTDEDHLAHAAFNLDVLITYTERVKTGKLPAELADMGPRLLGSLYVYPIMEVETVRVDHANGPKKDGTPDVEDRWEGGQTGGGYGREEGV